MIIQASPDRIMRIGRVGEDPLLFVEFDVSRLIADSSLATTGASLDRGFSLTEAWNIIYEQNNLYYLVDPTKIKFQDNKLLWEIDSTITTVEGIGRCQIVFQQAVGEKILRKSPIYFFSIEESLIGTIELEPPLLEDWISDLLNAGKDLTSILQKLYDSGADINKIIDAADEAEILIKLSPEIYKLEENVDMAEAWAVGTKDGVPVAVGEVGYNNNSKYWAEQSAASATSSTDAKTAAESAKKDAEAAKTAAENAKTAAETAKKDAETAKKDAETAKTDAINAKKDAEAAKTDAVSIKKDTEAAKTDAVNAKKDAETAKTAAANAKKDAETAKTDAEAARDEAKKWAIAPIEDLAEGSSKYWAGKSAESTTEAKKSADAAEKSANAASDAKDLALKYIGNPPEPRPMTGTWWVYDPLDTTAADGYINTHEPYSIRINYMFTSVTDMNAFTPVDGDGNILYGINAGINIPSTALEPEKTAVYVYTEKGWEYLVSLGGTGDGNMKGEIYDPTGEVAVSSYTDPDTGSTITGIPAYVKNNGAKIILKNWTSADLMT